MSEDDFRNKTAMGLVEWIITYYQSARQEKPLRTEKTGRFTVKDHRNKILRYLWKVAVYIWIRFGHISHRFLRWSPRCIRVFPAKRLKIRFKYFVNVGTAEMLVRGGAAVFRGPGTIVIQYTRKYLRPKVYERDGYCCVYCGQSDELTLDHVVPRSKGGLTVPDNLVTACLPCNQAKAARDLDDFLCTLPKGYASHRTLERLLYPAHIQY